MLPMFFMAGVLTVVLAIIFIGALVVGIIFACIRRLRFLAPFFLCIPTLAALAAVAGSWGTSIWVHNHYPPQSGSVTQVLPFWCWVLGLPAGAVLGALLGLGIALVVRRRFRATNPTLQRTPGSPPVINSGVSGPAPLS